MLGAPMRHRLLALSLSLVLLLAQQLGVLHLLAHGLQPHAPAAAHTAPLATPTPDAGHASDADAGDALCQVCLVLATLGAALWQRQEAVATRAVAEQQRAQAQQRFAQVRQLAHALYGAASTLGADGIAAAARQLERPDLPDTAPGADAARQAALDALRAGLSDLARALADTPATADEPAVPVA